MDVPDNFQLRNRLAELSPLFELAGAGDDGGHQITPVPKQLQRLLEVRLLRILLTRFLQDVQLALEIRFTASRR